MIEVKVLGGPTRLCGMLYVDTCQYMHGPAQEKETFFKLGFVYERDTQL